MTGTLARHTRLLAASALVAPATLVWACSNNASAPGGGTNTADAALTVDSLQRGSLVEADALANTRIGGPFHTALAFRFRATWTGRVTGVRFYIITNPSDRTGYSGGDGGSLRVTLAPDSGGPRHVPSQRSLASMTVRRPKEGDFPLVEFPPSARVVAGRLYHVTFTNVDPDPRRNYVSVNALIARRHGRLARPLPDGMAVLLGNTRDGARPKRWFPRSEDDGERYIPILDVVGSGDRHSGVGYTEVWEGNPKPIGGNAMVRQTFQPTSGRVITGAWLRVRRTRGSAAPLQLRIETVEGATLTAATVSPSTVPRSGPGWVHVRFPKPASAPAGTALALAAASSSDDAYEAFPIRQGNDYGFDASTFFDRGYAQFTEPGVGWIGWDQWGARDRRDGDLEFALETAAD
jgi:hypothetical protein